MKKKALLLIILISLSAGSVAAEEQGSKAEYLIKMATIGPEMGEAAALVHEMKTELEEKTGGRVLLIWTRGISIMRLRWEE